MAAAHDEETGTALVQNYEAAQLQALKTGLLVAAAVALLALLFTRKLPSRRPTDEPEAEAVPAVAST